MARVLLISTNDPEPDFWVDDCRRITKSVAKDVFKVHSLTDDADAADLIVFFEPSDTYLASDVRRHPYAQLYPEKAFLVDASDRVIPFLPGIYASIRKQQHDPGRTRSGFFPGVFDDRHWVKFNPDGPPPDLLFSFVGSFQNLPVRTAIGRLQHPRSVVQDTESDPANLQDCTRLDTEEYHRRYAEVLARSKFVLCPKGAGTATPRFFEAMKAGRVPVIISDEWVAPDGPEWPAFSLVVKEQDVDKLPEFLEQREGSAGEMGARARSQWELWFSEAVAFHRIVEWCLSIKQQRTRPERLMRTLVLWQLLEPFNFRHKLVAGLKRRLRAQP